jgi:hypothetical protein
LEPNPDRFIPEFNVVAFFADRTGKISRIEIHATGMEDAMPILLWLLGIPIPILIILFLFHVI